VSVTSPPRPRRQSDPVSREEVEALIEALIEEARQRARRRRRRNTAVVTLVALVGVAVFAVLGRGAQSQTASPAVSARLAPAAQGVTSRIAFIREPVSGGYAGDLYVMNTDGSGQRRLSPAFPDMRWSPDGQKIAFSAWSHDAVDLYVMNADGSGQQMLTSDPDWDGGPTWSPDGRALAFTSVADIYVINADGSERRRLARDARPGELAWSPLGNKIAFVRDRDGDLEIYIMNPDGSGQRRLTRNTVRDSHAVWSPDGRKIAFESNWQVWVMNADGSRQRRLTLNGARNFAPAWSPDGQRIAFERRLGRQQSSRCSGCGNALAFEVWVMNADGSGQRKLTERGEKPGWSPDGRRIAFVSKRDGNHEIYVMNPDGSGQRNLTRSRGPRESWLVWSPTQKK
jgi:Tol biopolymer transport system component